MSHLVCNIPVYIIGVQIEYFYAIITLKAMEFYVFDRYSWHFCVGCTTSFALGCVWCITCARRGNFVASFHILGDSCVLTHCLRQPKSLILTSHMSFRKHIKNIILVYLTKIEYLFNVHNEKKIIFL